jgi:hypothetical protein
MAMKNLCALVLLVTAMTITGCAEKKPAAPPAPPAPAAGTEAPATDATTTPATPPAETK